MYKRQAEQVNMALYPAARALSCRLRSCARAEVVVKNNKARLKLYFIFQSLTEDWFVFLD